MFKSQVLHPKITISQTNAKSLTAWLFRLHTTYSFEGLNKLGEVRWQPVQLGHKVAVIPEICEIDIRGHTINLVRGENSNEYRQVHCT